MSIELEGWVEAENRLRTALLHSFQTEPEVAQAERVLHGSLDAQKVARFRQATAQSFDAGPEVAQAESVLHGSSDAQKVSRFRQATAQSFDAGPILADAERAALQALDPERLGKVRSLVDAHLAGRLAIPDVDLAIYAPTEATQPEPAPAPAQEPSPAPPTDAPADAQQVEPEIYAPTDEGIRQQRQQAQIESLEEIGRLTKEVVELEGEVEFELPMVPWPPALPSAAPPEEEPEIDAPSRPLTELGLQHPEDQVEELELADAATRAPIEDQGEALELEPALDQAKDAAEWKLEAGVDLKLLTPLPLVTAALEAVGLDAEQFGFLLRYGTYAPAGRTSQITVGGLGLAEFSRRAAEWFNALGATKNPIQVVDEGSGELTVYLLEGGPS